MGVRYNLHAQKRSSLPCWTIPEDTEEVALEIGPSHRAKAKVCTHLENHALHVEHMVTWG